MPTATHTDRYGNALATRSAVAADHYSAAVDCSLAGDLGAEALFAAAVEADDGFALAHVAHARLRQMRGAVAGAREEATIARRLVAGASPREQRHVDILASAIEGKAPRALDLIYQHVKDFPRDAFALSQATGVYGLIGFSGRQNRAEEQVQLLESLEPDYGDDWWFLSALAFAQIEYFLFEPARRNAERSLQLRRENGYGAHAMAHVHYEYGEAAAGASFLADWLIGYSRAAELHTHLSWHHALFLLNQGNFDAAFRLYRDHIRPEVSQSGALALIADSASILWRAQLYGADRELPWDDVRDFARRTFTKPGLMWADVHCALAYAAASDEAALGQLIDGLRARHAAGKIRAGEVVPALAEGIAAYAHGDYDAAIRILEPVQSHIVRIGGSHAQRELFEDTLLESYLRAGELEKAESWLRTRLDRRPSPRDLQWLERATVPASSNGDG